MFIEVETAREGAKLMLDTADIISFRETSSRQAERDINTEIVFRMQRVHKPYDSDKHYVVDTTLLPLRTTYNELKFLMKLGEANA